MGNWLESSSGKFPWRPLLVAVWVSGNFFINRDQMRSRPIFITIVWLLIGIALIDLVRYFLLRHWEGQSGIGVEADERAMAIAHKAAYRTFWPVTWAIVMWMWMSEAIAYDWRTVIAVIIFAGIICYTALELQGRRACVVDDRKPDGDPIEQDPPKRWLN